MQQGGNGQPAFALPLGAILRHSKAHRLHRAKAAAVLGDALHVQNLIEGDGRLLAFQLLLVAGTVGDFGADLPFYHHFAGDHLQLTHSRRACNIQNRVGHSVERKLVVGRDQLIHPCQAAHAGESRLLLLGSAVGNGGHHLLLQLGIDAGRHLVRAPHLHPPLVDRAAVQVFGLAAHHRAEAGKFQCGQLQRLAERQLLLGLAQALAVFALVVHDAAQIAFQIEPAGLHLLLQHHHFGKALDDFEHLRQIVRDQDLRFNGDLGFYGTKASRRRKRIAEYF